MLRSWDLKSFSALSLENSDFIPKLELLTLFQEANYIGQVHHLHLLPLLRLHILDHYHQQEYLECFHLVKIQQQYLEHLKLHLKPLYIAL